MSNERSEILDHPEIQRAAVIISQAKEEATRIFPGADEASTGQRHALQSLIIGQFTGNTNNTNHVSDGVIVTASQLGFVEGYKVRTRSNRRRKTPYLGR